MRMREFMNLVENKKTVHSLPGELDKQYERMELRVDIPGSDKYEIADQVEAIIGHSTYADLSNGHDTTHGVELGYDGPVTPKEAFEIVSAVHKALGLRADATLWIDNNDELEVMDDGSWSHHGDLLTADPSNFGTSRATLRKNVGDLPPPPEPPTAEAFSADEVKAVLWNRVRDVAKVEVFGPSAFQRQFIVTVKGGMFSSKNTIEFIVTTRDGVSGSVEVSLSMLKHRSATSKFKGRVVDAIDWAIHDTIKRFPQTRKLFR